MRNHTDTPGSTPAQTGRPALAISIPEEFRNQWSAEVDVYFDGLYTKHGRADDGDPGKIIQDLRTHLIHKIRASGVNPEWVKAIVLSHPEFRALEASVRRIREEQVRSRVPDLVEKIRRHGQKAHDTFGVSDKDAPCLSYRYAGAQRVAYSTKRQIGARVLPKALSIKSTPFSEEEQSRQIATAFARGDVETLRRLGVLETIDMSESVLPSSTGLDTEVALQIIGDPATHEHLERLIESYSVSKLTRVIQILQLRNGDVVEFRGLSDSHDKKILHFRIVKIESTQDSKDEYVINCLVNCFYERLKTGYMVKEKVMQIRMSKRTGLQEGGSLRVFASGSEFINSRIGAMGVYTPDKHAFGGFLRSPRFVA